MKQTDSPQNENCDRRCTESEAVEFKMDPQSGLVQLVIDQDGGFRKVSISLTAQEVEKALRFLEEATAHTPTLQEIFNSATKVQ